MADITGMLQASAGASGAWDLSRTSIQYSPFSNIESNPYLGKNFGTNLQATLPAGVAVSPDGTVMWVLDRPGDIYQYTLSTPFEISTASYTSQSSSLLVGGYATRLRYNLQTYPNSNSFYVLDGTYDRVLEFQTTSSWDITTAEFVIEPYTLIGAFWDQTFSVNSQATDPTSVAFKTDGTKMYVSKLTSVIYQYTLSTPWDITTATYDSVSKDLSGFVTNNNYSLVFKSDGLTFYLVFNSLDSVVQFELTTAWDLSSALVPNGNGLVAVSEDSGLDFSVASEGLDPFSVRLSTDGTNMYVLTSSNDTIFQYTLSTAWDISTASYASKSLDVSPEELSPLDFVFKPDGTKLYVIGQSGDDVNQYDLGTAWDISTASYVQNFSVAAQETQPTGLFFKPDGTKMYVRGNAGDDFNEYDLSTPWDISTATYFQTSPTALAVFSSGLYFTDDGKHVVSMDATNDRFFQYTLATAWDVSVLSNVRYRAVNTLDTTPYGAEIGGSGKYAYFVGNTNDKVYRLNVARSFYTFNEESSPTGIAFKTDGTKLYVIGITGDEVNEYDLSIAWDINTVSYVQTFSVAAQTTAPYSLVFNDSGTQMFVLGAVSTTWRMYTYDLATPWDISTASFVRSSVEAYNTTIDTAPRGITFADDGKYLYFAGDTNNSIYRYSLARSLDVGDQEATPLAIWFKPDGTKFYVAGTAGDDVNEYDLSVAGDITTATFVQNSGNIGNITSFTFNQDGTVLGIYDTVAVAVEYRSLLTPWDVSTGNLTLLSQTQVSFESTTMYGAYVAPNGKNFYYTSLVASTTTTPWIEQWPANKSFWVGAQETIVTGLAFKTDGTKMYVIGQSGDDVNEYDLSTAWDISTASYLQNFSVAAQESNPTGIFFKPDGTKMYVCGTVGDDVNEYDLSTPWDVSTAVYLQNFSVATEDTAPSDLFFKPDGTKMYVLGRTGVDVNEYDLSTPWDVSSASYVQNFSVAGQIVSPPGSLASAAEGLAFKPDGTKMYVVGTIAAAAVFEYVLTTAWDISTASYTDVSWILPERNCVSIAFNPTGRQMFVLGGLYRKVYAFELGVDVTPQGGSELFNTPGSYSWIAPAGVTSVSVVCIGGGGGTLAAGGNSSFDSTVVANGGGAGNGTRAGGGGSGGDGGGTGGSGAAATYGGGGGTGGYSGNGGDGAIVGASGTAGSGGAGGGGSGNSVGFGGSGGGVEPYGEGPSGVGGASGGNGGGGSVVFGYSSSLTVFGKGAGGWSVAGINGGGGAGLRYANNYSVTPGNSYTVVVASGLDSNRAGPGVVRIIWPGDTRQFPSENTQGGI